MASLTQRSFLQSQTWSISLWQQAGTLRKQIKASEQGTKQVGTCLLRYLSYIDWVFIIPLGKVSAGAKAKSHRHRPSPTTDEEKGKRQISFYIHARNHRFLSSIASRIEHSPNSICWL